MNEWRDRCTIWRSPSSMLSIFFIVCSLKRGSGGLANSSSIHSRFIRMAKHCSACDLTKLFKLRCFCQHKRIESSLMMTLSACVHIYERVYLAFRCSKNCNRKSYICCLKFAGREAHSLNTALRMAMTAWNCAAAIWLFSVNHRLIYLVLNDEDD